MLSTSVASRRAAAASRGLPDTTVVAPIVVVAAWLCGIIIDLVTGPGFYDVAPRDFGLLVGALALARLAQGVHNGSIAPR